MLTINEEEARLYLTPGPLVEALEQAFRQDYLETVISFRRIHLDLPSGITFLAMPSYDTTGKRFGIKLASVAEGTTNGDRVQADYVLFDSETREICAIIAANHLTDLRTAAMSAIATKLMSRPNAGTLGIFGTGRQATAHIRLLSEVIDFRTILICGSTHLHSENFVRNLENLGHSSPIVPVDARECAMRSDVICTCTTASQPLFDGSLVRPGTHLNLVGAYRPDTREVDDQTIKRAHVVVETYDGVLAEAGDILIPIANRIITRQHIQADLHEVLSGKKPGRTNASEITLFKSVGHAYEDLIAATLLYEAVRKSASVRRGN
jgi:ornithine cyclodeaminase/alanine dehydrogenase-like protein (mu-crystallin family)